MLITAVAFLGKGLLSTWQAIDRLELRFVPSQKSELAEQVSYCELASFKLVPPDLSPPYASISDLSPSSIAGSLKLPLPTNTLFCRLISWFFFNYKMLFERAVCTENALCLSFLSGWTIRGFVLLMAEI